MQTWFALNVTINLSKLIKYLLVSSRRFIYICMSLVLFRIVGDYRVATHRLTFHCCSPQAHNRNLLSIDFDQNTRVGKIYDDHRKFTLHIQYDPLGRPVVWSPSSKYTEVNISYSGGGLLSAIHRGEWSERLEYENERVVSRAWVNGKIWSYTYADRVRAVELFSQKTCSRGDVVGTHCFLQLLSDIHQTLVDVWVRCVWEYSRRFSTGFSGSEWACWLQTQMPSSRRCKQKYVISTAELTSPERCRDFSVVSDWIISCCVFHMRKATSRDSPHCGYTLQSSCLQMVILRFVCFVMASSPACVCLCR